MTGPSASGSPCEQARGRSEASEQHQGKASGSSRSLGSVEQPLGLRGPYLPLLSPQLQSLPPAGSDRANGLSSARTAAAMSAQPLVRRDSWLWHWQRLLCGEERRLAAPHTSNPRSLLSC